MVVPIFEHRNVRYRRVCPPPLIRIPIGWAGTVLLLLVSVSSGAQDNLKKSTTILPAGTLIRLRSTETIDSKHAKTGDTVPLEVMRDLVVGDLLVVAKHTKVIGTLVEVHHAARALRRGSLALEIKTVTDTAGNPIAVSVTTRVKPGPEKQIEGYADPRAWVLVPFFKGDEAVLPKGKEIDASVDKDQTVDAEVLQQRMHEIETERRATARANHNGLAIVHFYFHYPILPHLPPEDHVVLVDGHKLVRLRQGTFYDASLEAGPHTLECNGHTASLDAKPDEDYYFAVVRNPDGRGWVLHAADRETAEDEIYTLTAANPKDVYQAAQ